MEELLKIVTFRDENVSIQNPGISPEGERLFTTMAGEFALSEIRLDKDKKWSSAAGRSVEILLCLKGSPVIGFHGSSSHPLRKGESALIPSGAPAFFISGESRIFRASVPPHFR
jgi:mannose-6-phosphate isomerase